MTQINCTYYNFSYNKSSFEDFLSSEITNSRNIIIIANRTFSNLYLVNVVPVKIFWFILVIFVTYITTVFPDVHITLNHSVCCIFSFHLLFNTISEVSMVTSVTITRAPENPSITAGSMVSLTCEATVSGGVSPNYTWTTTGSGTSELLAGRENQAVISGKVRESDAGTYTCQASITGSSQNISVMLTATSMFPSYNISMNILI